MMGWSKLSPSLARGQLSIRDDHPFNAANPHYLRIESEAQAPFGVANEGFRGMGVRQGEAYDFSAQIRRVNGSAALRIELYGSDGTLLDSVRLKGFSTHWNKQTAVLHPKDTDPKARLYLLVEGKAASISTWSRSFREKTWKNRPAGLRADMVQMLADLKPGFLRFPGGCIVEGTDLSRRYQWKKTLGPVEERPLLINRWNYEFLHRPAPDYFQSFGLGFFEFFQLCEDIGAEPLPILNCGMACQFNSAELCPLDQLGPVHPGRAGSDRVRQRPGHQRMGRQARRTGPSGAVQPEDDGHRQRTMGAAIRRALRPVRQSPEGETPGDQLDRRRRPESGRRSVQIPVVQAARTRTPISWTSIAMPRPIGSSTIPTATTPTTATGPKSSWANTPPRACHRQPEEPQ